MKDTDILNFKHALNIRDIKSVLSKHGCLKDALQNEDFDGECGATTSPKLYQSRLAKKDLNTKNMYGDTALHVAARERSDGVVNLLVASGADVDARNLWGSTPLHEAIVYNVSHNVLPALISAANINRRDRKGDTALSLALKAKKWDLVPVLVQRGASQVGGEVATCPSSRSLQHAAMVTVRRSMPVKTDAAFSALGLPTSVADYVKLRHVADDIVGGVKGSR